MSRTKQHRMCVHSESEVRLACPIFQVVLRFMTSTRKIRNFILLDPNGVQPFTGDLVKVRGKVLVRNKVRVIFLPSGEHLTEGKNITRTLFLTRTLPRTF